MARVLNIHERLLPAPAEAVGALLDTLSSPGDRFWPRHSWPAMKFDRPLGVGAAGGHGPIRYVVESYVPGRSAWFRFTGPAGFDGGHGFELIDHGDGRTTLRHTVRMETRGPALVSWPLAYRWMHDALVEDGLDCAEAAFGLRPQPQPWSAWVRLLRWFVSHGKAQGQSIPPVAAPR